MQTAMHSVEELISLFFGTKAGDEALGMWALVKLCFTVFGGHFLDNQTVAFVNGAWWGVLFPRKGRGLLQLVHPFRSSPHSLLFELFLAVISSFVTYKISARLMLFVLVSIPPESICVVIDWWLPFSGLP